MSDLTKMFDFANKDSSVPALPQIRAASQDKNGDYNGAAICTAKYGGKEPPIPYGNQTNALVTETGFKGTSVHDRCHPSSSHQLLKLHTFTSSFSNKLFAEIHLKVVI